eukprot:4417444-Pyramimonas_sp.AAC.2
MLNTRPACRHAVRGARRASLELYLQVVDAGHARVRLHLRGWAVRAVAHAQAHGGRVEVDSGEPPHQLLHQRRRQLHTAMPILIINKTHIVSYYFILRVLLCQ